MEYTNITTTGNYNQTFTNVSGCDSVHTLVATINYSNTGTTSITACDSYVWNTQTITTTGNYNQTFINVSGCDSVHTLVATINYSNTGTTSITACNSYVWNTQTITTTGNYNQTFNNVSGCDSVHTLVATINYSNTGTTSITACDSYVWNGVTYTSSGSYTYTSSGSYTYTIGAIPDLPANRGQSPAVVGYNNKLYVFGGKYNAGPTPPYSTYDTGLTYDLGTRTWSNISPTMSEKRAWVDGAIWQDKVYIYSGTDDQTAASHQSMEIYDITNNSFSSVLTPDKRTHYAAGAINGKIYICGGYSYGFGGNTNSLIEYDISSGVFTTKASMPTPRVQHAGTVYNNKLYVMGGNGSANTSNSLQVYDPVTDTWSSLADMPAPRYSLKAVTLGNYIYAVGGSDGVGLKNTVFKYDPSVDIWTIESPMIEARADFGLGTVSGIVFAIGNWSGFTSSNEDIINGNVLCDSTATLNLTINPSTTSTSSHTSCDSYLWNGRYLYFNWIYTYIL